MSKSTAQSTVPYSAQRGGKTDCGFPARRAGTAQKLAPVLRLVSASLRLRFRSAATVARWGFISILLTAKRVKSLFTRAGDGFFGKIDFFARLWLREGTALTPGGRTLRVV